jgi:hypothetical protein
MNETSPGAVPTPKPGIRCPRCKGTKWKVHTTRQGDGKVLRVKTCLGCFLRVRTREVIEAVCKDQKPTSAA